MSRLGPGRPLCLGVRAKWLLIVLFACGEATPPVAPGFGLQRLNRRQYDRSVRDLLGVTETPANTFPEDELQLGFDNQADALHLSPLHLEMYLRAAERLAEALSPSPPSSRIEGTSLRAEVGAKHRDEGWRFRAGALTVPLPTLGPGHYRLGLGLRALAAGSTPPLRIELDERPLAEVQLSIDGPVIELAFSQAATATPQLGLVLPEANDGVVLDWVRIDGPLDPNSTACADRVCAAEKLSAWARRAFRRPLDPDPLPTLLSVYDRAYQDGEPPERALALALETILMSPHFLFRVEPAGGEGASVDAYSLASRLSYFFWSSLPDDALLARAEDGSLLDPVTQRAEVARLLDDPRSAGLIEGFGEQWLSGEALKKATPDPGTYPGLDPQLLSSAGTEQHLFLEALFAEDLPLHSAVSADFSVVDPVLARHYGWADPGPGWSKVKSEGGRRGVLGQAAFLIATAHPTRSSPVRRGKWILERLLCQSPPPPPPNIPGLPEGPGRGTARDQAEAHRSRPECKACHAAIDPLGLALEPFDGVGRARIHDDGRPIDARGQLLDGTPFNGPAELASVLAARPELSSCLTRQLAIYGLGRGILESEAEALTHWSKSPGWRSLASAIAESPNFRAARRRH